MYGGKMIWYDGTLAKTDFSSFYDSSFNPRVNKSNCYRFMTWAIEDNDFKIVAFECNQKDLPQKITKYEYDWNKNIQLVMDKDLSYPKRCALGDHQWKRANDDLKIDQPMFYRYHFVLFGLWYFRGAGYRWSDFSQNFNFEFIDPNFNPQLNISQCYRFLAIPC
uniref:Uncharacterized protein n=1 Tax=Wuchereria bancrofti TaxID=6293 RepID=A0A1I8EL34_WUCBA